LRQKCPIAHTDRFIGAYFSSRYEDVRTIAYDTEHFSSRRIIVREVRPPVIPAPDYFCGTARRQRTGASQVVARPGAVPRPINPYVPMCDFQEVAITTLRCPIYNLFLKS